MSHRCSNRKNIHFDTKNRLSYHSKMKNQRKENRSSNSISMRVSYKHIILRENNGKNFKKSKNK